MCYVCYVGHLCKVILFIKSIKKVQSEVIYHAIRTVNNVNYTYTAALSNTKVVQKQAFRPSFEAFNGQHFNSPEKHQAVRFTPCHNISFTE